MLQLVMNQPSFYSSIRYNTLILLTLTLTQHTPSHALTVFLLLSAGPMGGMGMNMGMDGQWHYM